MGPVRKNPSPGAPRAYKKWSRRSAGLQGELDLASKLDGYERAQKDYRSAQNVLGSVRANDFGELSLKSMASMAYEGAILDDPSACHHLRNEKQIVVWSIAFDVTLLASRSTEASALTGQFAEVARRAKQSGTVISATDPALEAIATHRRTAADHLAAILATDATEPRTDARWDAEDRQEAACDREVDAAWMLAKTIPTILAGVAAVLAYINDFELAGDVWPVEEAYGIGPDSWHYKLRQTMAAAVVNLA
ncbi:hypothetical protein GPL21_33260 [Bradyrhizobium pachyrhizi]|uniref:Uncharacterized protein n=1 Tax=Bradyrhizobium pachyrhizi TaxID=280333 RepID=A0A844SUI7_9BRAD|nr:hypothetical protein [Bradyrhizobium pachyrhizi]MVT69957.1 hypothetical protein [Bradyrhizobium pachyrhizi]